MVINQIVSNNFFQTPTNWTLSVAMLISIMFGVVHIVFIWVLDAFVAFLQFVVVSALVRHIDNVLIHRLYFCVAICGFNLEKFQ